MASSTICPRARPAGAPGRPEAPRASLSRPVRFRSVPCVARPARLVPATRGAVVVRAAAAGGADPYEVLGLKPDAKPEQVQRAYNIKTRENRGNEEALAKIESAHSSLMMMQLTSRMKGGVKVDKNVAYADRAVFFPWRPRVYVDEKKNIIRNLIVAAILATWAFGLMETCFTQPLIAATGVAIVGNYLKQCTLNPTGGQYATPEEKKNVSKNMIRAVGLALFGMFTGMFFFFTIPDFISAQLGKTLPYWVYQSQNLILNMGSITMNFITVSFLR